MCVALMARDAHGLGQSRDWFLDGTRSQFDRDALSVIGKALLYAKNHDGLQRLVLVIPQAMGRLVAKGLLAHAPVKVVVTDSRAEGLRIMGAK